MNRIAGIITLVVLMCCVTSTTYAQSEQLAARFAMLDVNDASDYLMLAEELADEANTPDEVRLARRLFVYTLQIGRESNDAYQRTLGASAALALAQKAATQTERRWLLSMAGELDSRFASALRDPRAPPAWDWSVGLQAAEALGLARSGDGRDALKRLDKPSVRAVLREISPLLGVRGGGGAAGLVERLARGWPCPECGGKRVIHKRRDGEMQLERCPTCLGNPGPRELTSDELSAHLRAELRLLHGSVRNWSAQIELDHGEPLREPSISGLQRFYRVDPLARVWSDGQWVRPIPPPPSPPVASPSEEQETTPDVQPTSQPADQPSDQ